MKLLADHDPATRQELSSADDKRHIRERIIRMPRPEQLPKKRLGPRRVLIPAATPRVVAVLLIGILVATFGVPRLIGGSSRGAIATPRLIIESSAEVPADPAMLTELSAAAVTHAPAAASHRAVVTWDLSTAVSRNEGRSEILVARRHLWIAPDRSVVTCESQRLGTEVLAAVEQQADAVPTCTRVTKYDPGEFHIPQLPTDATTPEELRARLATTPEIEDLDEVVTAFLDVANVRPLSPHENALLLDVLTEADDVIYHGMVQDRAGRDGQAFGYGTVSRGLPMEQILIFDPDSGELLAEETILTEDAGRLNVTVPSVIGYTVYYRSSAETPR
ncbi:MAG: hypothetical protein ACRD2X_09470 [Vicinamibacteraceae bacterium]